MFPLSTSKDVSVQENVWIRIIHIMKQVNGHLYDLIHKVYKHLSWEMIIAFWATCNVTYMMVKLKTTIRVRFLFIFIGNAIKSGEKFICPSCIGNNKTDSRASYMKKIHMYVNVRIWKEFFFYYGHSYANNVHKISLTSDNYRYYKALFITCLRYVCLSDSRRHT